MSNTKIQITNEFQNPKLKRRTFDIGTFGFDLAFGLWHLTFLIIIAP
jgi:hypothetical protein